jgi:methyl-accepting chemotaxis protein
MNAKDSLRKMLLSGSKPTVKGKSNGISIDGLKEFTLDEFSQIRKEMETSKDGFMKFFSELKGKIDDVASRKTINESEIIDYSDMLYSLKQNFLVKINLLKKSFNEMAEKIETNANHFSELVNDVSVNVRIAASEAREENSTLQEKLVEMFNDFNVRVREVYDFFELSEKKISTKMIDNSMMCHL